MRRIFEVICAAFVMACEAEPKPPIGKNPAPAPPPTPALLPALQPAPTAAPAPGATPAPATSARPIGRLVIDQAINRLSAWVKSGATDTTNAWAMAHALVAFGKEVTTSDGRLVIDVLVTDYVVEQHVGGKKRFIFPPRSPAGIPVEPHPNLIVKSLLEAGVPLDRTFKLAGGRTVQLFELVEGARASAALPMDDSSWQKFPWTLAVLLLAEPDPAHPSARKKTIGAPTVLDLSRATIQRLTLEQAFLTELRAENRPDLVEKRKQHIYAHPCGGMHLIQTAIRAQDSLAGELRPELAEQIETLRFRYRSERRIYADLKRSQPTYRRILAIQELKFFGHLLETLALANPRGLYPADAAHHTEVVQIIEDLLASLDDLAPDYQALSTVRREREQSYLDLIGDGCHAIRGLRESVVAFFPPP